MKLPNADNYWYRLRIKCQAKKAISNVMWQIDGPIDDGGKWAVVKADSNGNFPSSPTRLGAASITSYRGTTYNTTETITGGISANAYFYIEIWHYEQTGGQTQKTRVHFNSDDSGEELYITTSTNNTQYRVVDTVTYEPVECDLFWNISANNKFFLMGSNRTVYVHKYQVYGIRED